MRTKHLKVLIHIRIKGEVGTENWLKSPVIFLLTVPTRCFFSGFLYYDIVLSVSCSLEITCWDRADFLALLNVIFFLFLSLSIWYPGSGVVLDCIDS